MSRIALFFFIAILGVACQAHDESQPPQPPLEGAFTTQLDSIIEASAKLASCRISLKVEAPDQRSFYTGFDGRTKQPISDFDDLLEIGSCTKLFTSASILQLIENGKLSLESKLTDVLPNDTLYQGLMVIDGQDYIDSITVLQLLNHTSGLPDYFIPNDSAEIVLHANKDLDYPPSKVVAMAKTVNPPSFKPGSGKWKYSNTGYFLLGLIIEKVSGQRYEDYVQQHILDRLGVKNTYFMSDPPATKKEGHYNQEVITMPPSLAWSAGNMIADLDDMETLVRGWYEGKLFSPATLEMVKNQHFMPMMAGGLLQYGLGVIKLNNSCLGHEGGTFGMQTYMGCLPNGYCFSLGIDDGAVAAWDLAIVTVNKLGNLPAQ